MVLTVRTLPVFLFVGNHACLDFINTSIVSEGEPVDLLTTFSDLIAWFKEAKLLTEEDGKKIERQGSQEATGAQMLTQARAFRQTLRDMIERIAAGRPVPQAAVEAINEHLRHRAGYSQVTGRGRHFEKVFEDASQDPKRLLGVLAEAAGDLVCTSDFALIKKCQNPACVLFFYDTTKNHTRHWCSMNLCGNRSKVAAHYRRRKKLRPT
ncbi:MAG TPA: CGNR zinc finger domain-containing protein [Nitrospira sp.]